MSGATLRRELKPREQVNRCAKCGRVEIPLDEDELWHYAVTGEGLGESCPRGKRRFLGCNWQPLYCAR